MSAAHALPITLPTPTHRRYFFEKFGITERLLERCLEIGRAHV